MATMSERLTIESCIDCVNHATVPTSPRLPILHATAHGIKYGDGPSLTVPPRSTSVTAVIIVLVRSWLAILHH
jgi:hypothetical protein